MVDSICEQQSHNYRKHYLIQRFSLVVSHHQEQLYQNVRGDDYSNSNAFSGKAQAIKIWKNQQLISSVFLDWKALVAWTQNTIRNARNKENVTGLRTIFRGMK